MKPILAALIAVFVACAVSACGVAVDVGSATTEPQQGEQQASSSQAIRVVGSPQIEYLGTGDDLGWTSRGHFYSGVAIIKNETGSDLAINAQFSVSNKSGLLGNGDAQTTLLAGQEGALISHEFELPPSLKKHEVEVAISENEAELISDELRDPNAITLEDPRIRPADGSICRFSVTALNHTSEAREVSITWVGLRKGTPIVAAQIFPTLLPDTPKIIDVQYASLRKCSARINEVRVYWAP